MSGIKKVGFVGIGRMGYPMAGHLVAAGFEVAVADGKPVGIVKDLDIVAVALGEIYRVFVFPVVMVLMEGDRANPAWGEVEGGMAEVVVVVDRLLQERGDEGVVDEPVADGAAVVPGADEIGFCLWIRCFAQGIEILADIIDVENFRDEFFARVLCQDVWVVDIAVVVKGIEIGG